MQECHKQIPSIAKTIGSDGTGSVGACELGQGCIVEVILLSAMTFKLNHGRPHMLVGIWLGLDVWDQDQNMNGLLILHPLLANDLQ